MAWPTEQDLARRAIQRQVTAGVRVRLAKSMGVQEGRVIYCVGIVSRRDGDDFMINVEYYGPNKALRISGVECHRFLCEIEEAFINNEWVRVWPK